METNDFPNFGLEASAQTSTEIATLLRKIEEKDEACREIKLAKYSSNFQIKDLIKVLRDQPLYKVQLIKFIYDKYAGYSSNRHSLVGLSLMLLNLRDRLLWCVLDVIDNSENLAELVTKFKLLHNEVRVHRYVSNFGIVDDDEAQELMYLYEFRGRNTDTIDADIDTLERVTGGVRKKGFGRNFIQWQRDYLVNFFREKLSEIGSETEEQIVQRYYRTCQDRIPSGATYKPMVYEDARKTKKSQLMTRGVKYISQALKDDYGDMNCHMSIKRETTKNRVLNAADDNSYIIYAILLDEIEARLKDEKCYLINNDEKNIRNFLVGQEWIKKQSKQYKGVGKFCSYDYSNENRLQTKSEMINILDCIKVVLNEKGHHGYDRIIEMAKRRQLNKYIITPSSIGGHLSDTRIRVNGTLSTGERATMLFNTLMSMTIVQYVKDQIGCREAVMDSFMGDDYKGYYSSASMVMCMIGGVNYVGGIGQSSKAMVNSDRYEWLRNTYNIESNKVRGSVNRSIASLCSGNWESLSNTKTSRSIIEQSRALSNQINTIERRGMNSELCDKMRIVCKRKMRKEIEKKYKVSLNDDVMTGNILYGGLGFGDKHLSDEDWIVVDAKRVEGKIHKSVVDAMRSDYERLGIYDEKEINQLVETKKQMYKKMTYGGKEYYSVCPCSEVKIKDVRVKHNLRERMTRLYNSGQYKLFFKIIDNLRSDDDKRGLHLIPNKAEVKRLGGMKKLYKRFKNKGLIRCSYETYKRYLKVKEMKKIDRYASIGSKLINSEIEKMFLEVDIEIRDDITNLGKY